MALFCRLGIPAFPWIGLFVDVGVLNSGQLKLKQIEGIHILTRCLYTDIKERAAFMKNPNIY